MAGVANTLTRAQYTFALEYIANGFNATQAYLRAHPGVTLNTAKVEGHRTLGKPKVRAFLNPQLEAMWKAQQISGDEVLGRIAQDARLDISDLFDDQGQLLNPSDWPPSIAGSVKAVQHGPYGLKVTLVDPLKARRTILDHLGKPKPRGDSVDALAAAIRGDLERHDRRDAE